MKKKKTSWFGVVAGIAIIAIVLYWQLVVLQYGRGYTASPEAKAIYSAEQNGKALEYFEEQLEGHFDIMSFKVNESGKILTIRINNDNNKATGTATGNKAYRKYIYKYGGLILATTDKLKYVEWRTVGGDSPGINTCNAKTYSKLTSAYSHDFIKKYGKSAKAIEELMERCDAQDIK